LTISLFYTELGGVVAMDTSFSAHHHAYPRPAAIALVPGLLDGRVKACHPCHPHFSARSSMIARTSSGQAMVASQWTSA
jgi:hypothetical protein